MKACQISKEMNHHKFCSWFIIVCH